MDSGYTRERGECEGKKGRRQTLCRQLHIVCITWRRTDPLAFRVHCETTERVGGAKAVSMEREDLLLQHGMHIEGVGSDMARGGERDFCRAKSGPDNR